MPPGIYIRDPEVEANRRVKISATLKGQASPLRGRLMPEETKQKISEAMTGPKHSAFKGQRISSGGYILVYQVGRGYIKRADLVMEQKIGRRLHPDEISHHKNEVITDDRPENLELYANTAEHSRYHALKRGFGVIIQPSHPSRFKDWTWEIINGKRVWINLAKRRGTSE